MNGSCYKYLINREGVYSLDLEMEVNSSSICCLIIKLYYTHAMSFVWTRPHGVLMQVRIVYTYAASILSSSCWSAKGCGSGAAFAQRPPPPPSLDKNSFFFFPSPSPPSLMAFSWHWRGFLPHTSIYTVSTWMRGVEHRLREIADTRYKSEKIHLPEWALLPPPAQKKKIA